MGKRQVDEAALARAVRVTGEPASVLRVVVKTYLDGLEARALVKNPRVVRLANMAVGDRVVIPYPDTGRREGLLPSVDKHRARVLMENSKAQWTSQSMTSGLHVTRVR